MKKTTEKNNVSQQMRVRYYVMNLIYRNSGKSVKIPSSRELAARFGIARSTVQLALEKLVQEKYIISKQGVATVTNPVKSLIYLPDTKVPLIGIKIYEGDAFYYGKGLWGVFSAIANELIERKFYIRLMMDAATTPESIEREINESYLDGLILYNTKLEYYQAVSQKFPCILIRNGDLPEVPSSIILSKKCAIAQMAEILKKENRSRIADVVCQSCQNDEFQVCPSLQKIWPDLKVETVEFSKLPELLQKNPPDALIFREQFAEAIQELVDKNGCDTLLFSRKKTLRDMNYKGYCFSFPFEKVACTAADMLNELLNGTKELPPVVIEAELCRNNQ